MMKKLKSLILVLLVAVMLTGCMKVEMNMKVTKEEVGLTYVMGIEKQYLEMMDSEDPFADTKKDMQEQGFTVSDYDDGKYKGVKGTVSLGTLEQLSTKEDILDGEFDPTSKEVSKIFKIDDSDPANVKYSAKLKINTMDEINEYDSEDSEDSEDSGIDMDSLKETMVVNFAVELPSTPIKSNATSTNGNVLTWDLKNFKEEYIEFEFTLDGKGETPDPTKEDDPKKEEEKKDEEEKDNLLLYIAIGGGVLLLIIIIIIIIMSKKKKNKPEVVAPLAEKPIPEVGENKESSLTPINPTAPVAPAVTSTEEKPVAPVAPVESKPVEPPKVGPAIVSVPEVSAPKVEVEEPKVEAPTVTVEPPKVEAPVAPTVTVEAPKVETPAVTVAVPEVTTPEEAKTE